MAAQIKSYSLDQLLNRIRKKKNLPSIEFESVNQDQVEPIQDLKRELNEKLKFIRESLETND